MSVAQDRLDCWTLDVGKTPDSLVIEPWYIIGLLVMR